MSFLRHPSCITPSMYPRSCPTVHRISSTVSSSIVYLTHTSYHPPSHTVHRLSPSHFPLPFPVSSSRSLQPWSEPQMTRPVPQAPPLPSPMPSRSPPASSQPAWGGGPASGPWGSWSAPWGPRGTTRGRQEGAAWQTWGETCRRARWGSSRGIRIGWWGARISWGAAEGTFWRPGWTFYLFQFFWIFEFLFMV